MGKTKNLLQDFHNGEYSYDGVDDEYFYNKSKQITMEEAMKNHDEWWNSLTEEEKNHLYNEHRAAENAYNEWIADANINQLKDQGLL